MQNRFQQFIADKKLFSPGDKILIAVSGGIDSVCLCRLFFDAGFNFGIAHCNFKLRDEDSEQDELFVKNLAEKYNVPFFTKAFETTAYAENKKISIQMAARNLRYEWFQMLSTKHGYPYIATAHHLNDSIETVFLNILRGTGLAGLSGIPVKNKNIIRPLLFATREKIENFAREKKLEWREDRSNADTDYLRNELRKNILPLFKKINPSFDDTMAKNISRFSEAELVYNHSISHFKNELLQDDNDHPLIDIKRILNQPFSSTLLYELLKDYNFKDPVINDIISGINSQPGKQFYSLTHCVTRDRDHLIVSALADPDKEEFLIEPDTSEISQPLSLSFKRHAQFRGEKKNNMALLEYRKLKFPLVLRRWKHGDDFQPSGMKGRKKLSDFFIDKKLPVPEKNNIWLLTSGGEIAWVVGYRISEQFKAGPQTKEVLEVILKEKS